jgi:hypothetical protein
MPQQHHTLNILCSAATARSAAAGAVVASHHHDAAINNARQDAIVTKQHISALLICQQLAVQR